MGDRYALVGVPTAGAIHPTALAGLFQPASKMRFTVQPEITSLPTHGFNKLVCLALNNRTTVGFTDFAMHHSDIEAQPSWLDVLREERDRVGADIISACIRLKDETELTSTGIRARGEDIRRLSLAEIAKLPRTFCADDVELGKELAINSGLWLASLDVLEDCPGFQTWSEIRKVNGLHHPVVLSEDWAFAEWAAKTGKKVFATSAVIAVHHGDYDYRNDLIRRPDATDEAFWKRYGNSQPA